MRRTILLLLTLPAVLLSGCAGQKNYGSLRLGNDVAALFRNHEAVPGYTYYYNGRAERPDAIIGIDSAYTVEGRFWRPATPGGENPADWLRGVSGWKMGRIGGRTGAEILDPDGERVGVFYSKYDKLVTVFPGGDVIQVYAPGYRAGAGFSSSDEDRK